MMGYQNARGVTLMELLLVIAVLAVVAAVGASAFFKNAGDTVTLARISMMKAGYSAIRAAIDSQVRDRLKVAFKVEEGTDGPVTLLDSRMERLLKSGYLNIGSARFEDKTGKETYFEIKQVSVDPNDTTLPPFMQTLALHVGVVGKTIDFDALLKAQKSWPEIWELVNQ